MQTRKDYTPIQRLFRAFTHIPSLEAIDCVWERSLGKDYRSVFPHNYFSPLQKPAQSYPCPFDLQQGCVAEVIQQPDGKIFGICDFSPRRCDPFPLTETQLVVRKFNCKAFVNDIAKAMELQGNIEAMPDYKQTWYLGYFDNGSIPVYVTLSNNPVSLETIIDGIAFSRSMNPFLLGIPFLNSLRLKATEKLLSIKAKSLALSGILSLYNKRIQVNSTLLKSYQEAIFYDMISHSRIPLGGQIGAIVGGGKWTVEE